MALSHPATSNQHRVGEWSVLPFMQYFHTIIEGMPLMPDRKLCKVTYSLPEELVDGVRSVVRDGAAPSYSAFVQRALADGISRAREQLLAEAFRVAAEDPDFLADIDWALRDDGFTDDVVDQEH
jgi:Arc/MetJ-type ribon-helix-helix transcriptional regulator